MQRHDCFMSAIVVVVIYSSTHVASLLLAGIISALLGYSPMRASAYLTRPENLAWLLTTRDQLVTWRVCLA